MIAMIRLSFLTFSSFESRSDCEEIIRSFNNKTITCNNEEHTIQIRYADTQEQKHLKQTTAAARQFRSAEYEFATQAHRTWMNGATFHDHMAGQENESPHMNEFEAYLGQQVESVKASPGPKQGRLTDGSYISRGKNTSGAARWRTNGYRSPLSVIAPSEINARRPARALSINSTPLAKAPAADINDGGVSLPSTSVSSISVGEDSNGSTEVSVSDA